MATFKYPLYREMLRTRPVRLNLLLTSSLIFSIATFYFMELAVINEVKANRVPSKSDTASAPCVIVRKVFTALASSVSFLISLLSPLGETFSGDLADNNVVFE